MPRPQDTGRLSQCCQFGFGDSIRRYRIVGESRETAVRRQEHALGTEDFDGALGMGDDGINALDMGMFLITGPNTDAKMIGQGRQHFDFASPWCTKLEQQRDPKQQSAYL